MSALLLHLLELLEEASAGLRNVTRRKMFGCEVMFANGNIYAMVWKTGRIALKLPDEKLVAELMALPGSEPWEPGGKMKPKSWVLVPEELHDDTATLAAWVKRAHALNAAAPAKASKKKPPAKKPAAKKPRNREAPDGPGRRVRKR